MTHPQVYLKFSADHALAGWNDSPLDGYALYRLDALPAPADWPTDADVREIWRILNRQGGGFDHEAVRYVCREVARTITPPQDRVAGLVEALKEIEKIGTRTETNRVGDAWAENGWEDIEILSPEAEIARAALSAFQGAK